MTKQLLYFIEIIKSNCF